MNKLFWNTTIHCRQLKNACFDVKNDVISGVLFHLKVSGLWIWLNFRKQHLQCLYFKTNTYFLKVNCPFRFSTFYVRKFDFSGPSSVAWSLKFEILFSRALGFLVTRFVERAIQKRNRLSVSRLMCLSITENCWL